MAQRDRSTFQGTDIPTINDGGGNTASEVRTLATNLSDSVLFLNEPKAIRYITCKIPGTLATGDGTWGAGRYFVVPAAFNGMDIVSVEATVDVAGSSGSANLFQIRNATLGADVLSTRLMIDAGELTSATAATPAVINTSNDALLTGDILYIDIDQLNTTPPQTLKVRIGVR